MLACNDWNPFAACSCPVMQDAETCPDKEEEEAAVQAMRQQESEALAHEQQQLQASPGCRALKRGASGNRRSQTQSQGSAKARPASRRWQIASKASRLRKGKGGEEEKEVVLLGRSGKKVRSRMPSSGCSNGRNRSAVLWHPVPTPGARCGFLIACRRYLLLLFF